MNTAKPEILNLLSSSESEELANQLIDTVYSIKEDYFSEVSDSQFVTDYVFHESVVMKCVAMRFASSTLWQKLRQRVLEQTDKLDNDLLYHPIFYTRFSHAKWHNKNAAFLDSQPHYDRAFGIYAYSFWISLLEANEASGGLCFFSDNEKLKEAFYTEWGQKNKFNYDLYVENCHHLDESIKQSLINPMLLAGQAYMFDSNILHGATKPKTDHRLSFDFRFIPKGELNCSAEARNIIDNFNANINLSNALNLFVMGDIIGAKKLSNKLELYMDIITPKYDITVPRQKFSWRDEYLWCKQPYCIRLEQC